MTDQSPDLAAEVERLKEQIAKVKQERDELLTMMLRAYETDLRYAEMETAFVSGDNVVVSGMKEAANARAEAENAVWLKGQELYAEKEKR